MPEECTVPWFSLADIWQVRDGRQKYLGETSEKVSARGLANSAARVLPAGTVALSRTASVGFAGIMPRPMATTQDFANFVCGPRLLPDFLLWVLRGMKSEFDRMMMGSTHQTIYMPALRQFRVPLPPVPVQRTIAAYLDRKTAAIDALIVAQVGADFGRIPESDPDERNMLGLLREYRQTLITAAVTGQIAIPEGVVP